MEEEMAATRLIALHVNKGKTVAQCLNELLDYSQNPVKTEKGELISSYACDPETAAGSSRTFSSSESHCRDSAISSALNTAIPSLKENRMLTGPRERSIPNGIRSAMRSGLSWMI